MSNQRPLLDSGTMGTKGHTEIIVPNLTESYNSHVSVCVLVVCSPLLDISFAHECVFFFFNFFNLERPPRRGDPVLHAKILPFGHRAHHSVGERQSECSRCNPTPRECYFCTVTGLSLLARSSLRTLSSTSRPCTTPSGRPTLPPRPCCRSDSQVLAPSTPFC